MTDNPTPPSHEEMIEVIKRCILQAEADYPNPYARKLTGAHANALRAALAQLSRWRPIESAPWGMRVLVAGQFLAPRIAVRHPGGAWLETGTEWEVSPEYWFDDIPPLPAPPATTSEGSEGA